MQRFHTLIVPVYLTFFKGLNLKKKKNDNEVEKAQIEKFNALFLYLPVCENYQLPIVKLKTPKLLAPQIHEIIKF